eukprot:m.154928 g.154928  ORF g.154928 m.154928 type:complete len:324 (-) comp17514_c0_seq1:375-1346(-)
MGVAGTVGAAALIAAAAVFLTTTDGDGSTSSHATSHDRPDRFLSLLAPGASLQTLASGFSWAEGPVYSAPLQSLLLSDVKRNTIHRLDVAFNKLTLFRNNSGCYNNPTRCKELIEPGSNGLAFDPQSGRLVACQHGERAVAFLGDAPDGSDDKVIARKYNSRRLNSPNDLAFAPNGDLYFTDPSYGLNGKESDAEREQTRNNVYFVPAKELRGILHGQQPAHPRRVTLPARHSRPNGIALDMSSEDQGRIFLSNSNSSDCFWTVSRLVHLWLLNGGMSLRKQTQKQTQPRRKALSCCGRFYPLPMATTTNNFAGVQLEQRENN